VRSEDEVKLRAFVPKHLVEGLIRWVDDGIRPGSFLCAVLANDLMKAVERMDMMSHMHLPGIIHWLDAHAPIDCHGSEEQMRLYEEKFQAQKPT
jgi:hypothetical protein